jgi:hypothetical protein
MEKQIFIFPRWLTILYAASAVVLMPWTYLLAEKLPTRLLAHHWDLAWAGFDAFESLLLLTTVFLAIKKSVWLPMIATSLATVLLIDAWFDVLTSVPGQEQLTALVLAIFIEAPLAILTFVYAYQTTLLLHRQLDTKSIHDK